MAAGTAQYSLFLSLAPEVDLLVFAGELKITAW
jgi:hypothetical protein